MRWTCPKCGKKMDISNERLIACDGVIVCPQCLLQARQPLPMERSTTQSNKPAKEKTTKRDNISFDDSPTKRQPSGNTPPPYRGRRQQSSTSTQYNGLSAKQINSNTTRRTPAKKSSKKKQSGSKTMNGWGCMGKSILFTLILFAAYIFFGLVLEALQ